MIAVQAVMLIGAFLTLFLATAAACRRLSTREQACWNGEWMSRKKFDRLQQREASERQQQQSELDHLNALTDEDLSFLVVHGWDPAVRGRVDRNVRSEIKRLEEEMPF